MARHQAVVAGVTIDWDDAKHPVLNAKEGQVQKTKDKTKIPSSRDDEFTPEQIIVDLKLDLGNSSVKYVDLNDVHLQVPYTGSDPIIGWWDGKRWVRRTRHARLPKRVIKNSSIAARRSAASSGVDRFCSIFQNIAR